VKHIEVRRSQILALLVGILLFSGFNKKVVTAQTVPPPAPTVTINAVPSAIKKGGSSILEWTSANATQLTLSPDGGSVAAKGSKLVSPSDSITYTITAVGPGGMATATAFIKVSPPAPAPTASGPALQQLRQGGPAS
jgi:hypothetical protein